MWCLLVTQPSNSVSTSAGGREQEPKPYRFLVEKHLLSISHAVMDRYDDMMEQLLEPEVLDLAERYSGALQQIYKSYCTLDDCLAYRCPTPPLPPRAPSPSSSPCFAFWLNDGRHPSTCRSVTPIRPNPKSLPASVLLLSYRSVFKPACMCNKSCCFWKCC